MSAPEDITCREIVEIVTDYLEGALPPEQREAFELHLSYCDGCVNYLDQMRETIRITGELREESLPPELQAELLRAFGDLHRT
jgi:anti-sigma factor RsiW